MRVLKRKKKITLYNSLYIYHNIGNHWGIYYMWALRIILTASCMSFIIVSVDLQDQYEFLSVHDQSCLKGYS